MADGDSAAQTQERSRLGRVLAVVASVVGVATLALGVLTYLQSRPSGAAEYAKQVSSVCQSAKVRQVPITSALDARGGYSDHDAYVRFVTAQVAADRQTVDEFKQLKAPSEVRDQDTEARRLGDRWLVEDDTYLASLSGLPAAAWKKKFPRQPGDVSSLALAGQQFFAALEKLSGGTCASPVP